MSASISYPKNVRLPYTSSMKTELWQRIAAARKYGRKTQSDVAAAMAAEFGGSFTRNAVSLWESPNPDVRTTPSLEQLKVLSHETGVDILWLVTDGESLDPKGVSIGGDTPRHTGNIPVRRIEIRGSAVMGQDGFWTFFGDSQEAYVEWATSYPDAFAVRVGSDLYHPEIRQGHVMLFSPSKVAVFGEYVYVERRILEGRDPFGKGRYGIFEFLAEDSENIHLARPKTGDRLTLRVSDVVQICGWIGTAPASARQIP